MADNFAITAGSGTTIATDDIGGGVQVQRVKPVWGVDGTGTDTSATNPLPVSIPAIVHVSQTPTVSTSPAYTAKDAVGGLLTFSNAVRASGGSGTILTCTIYDLSQQRPSLELVLFDRTFTNSTDNAVFDPTDGDLANCLGVIAVNNWSDFNDNSIATVSAVGLGFVLNGTSLFGQMLTRSTPTFVGTSDIKVDLEILQG
jgi:hypothetical protein